MRFFEKSRPYNPRSPLLPSFLVLVVGIGSGTGTLPFISGVLLMIVVSGSLGWWLGVTSKQRALIAVALMSIGLLGQWRMYHYRHTHAPPDILLAPRAVTWTCEVLRVSGSGPDGTGRFMIARVHAVSDPADAPFLKKKIFLRAPRRQGIPLEVEHTRVTAHLILRELLEPQSTNPFEAWLLREGVSVTATLENWDTVQSRPSLLLPFRLIRKHWTRHIESFRERLGGDVGLFLAISLGERRAVDPTTLDAFAHTGTLHLFAVSGMHVLAVLGGVIALLRLAGIPIWLRPWFTILIVGTYVFTTGPAASAIRAYSLILLYYIGQSLHRRVTGFPIVVFSAWIFLLVDPTALFDLGFLLSYSVVMTILLHGPLLRTLVMSRVLARQSNRNDSSVRLYRTYLRNPAINCLVISTAAFVGSAPWIASAMGLITPFSIVSNLLMVGLGMLLLYTTLSMGLLTWILPEPFDLLMLLPAGVARIARLFVEHWDYWPIAIQVAPMQASAAPYWVLFLSLAYTYYLRVQQHEPRWRHWLIAQLPIVMFLIWCIFRK